MYKLLVLDMDGTLLNEHQKISDLTKEAIKRIAATDIKVVIATGRTKQGIDPYIKELGLEASNNYSIVCSGALVTTNTDEALWRSSLSYEDFMEIYHLKEKHNLDINVYTDDSILIEKDNYYSEFDAVANNLPLVTIDFNTMDQTMPLLKTMLINEDLTMAKDFNKIFPSMDVTMPEIEAKEGYNRRLFYSFDIFSDDFMRRFNISRVTPYNIEISNKNANKRAGVEFLANMLDIKQEEIICIGDSGNDRQMIKYAGLGVAMGNAFPEIKEIADLVTKDNNNDGVAHVISTYLLNNAI